MTDHETLLGIRRDRRKRGWIEVLTGIALVIAGIVVTVWTYDSAVKSGGGRYLIAGGPVIAGFAALVRGTVRLLDLNQGLMLPQASAGHHRELSFGVGFRSFVAWRYLMAREHRVGKIVLFVFFGSLFLGIGGIVAERLLDTHQAQFIETDTTDWLLRTVTIVKFGGFILAYFAAIVGALRYVFSFFSTVPLVGVWIGTFALVCVLSVMSGFESDLREKILGSNAQIQVTREDGDFTDWHKVKSQIDAIPGVVASTPYAVSEVVIAANNNGMNVIIKGIDPKSVGRVTELVKDLEDPDAMKRLEPLVDDPHDLKVPQQAAPGGRVIDPPPADMPRGTDPIDFSQGASTPAGSGSGAALDERPDTFADKVIDPPPPDLVTSDEPPIDYSDAGSGDIDPTIHITDLTDQPTSRRTQSLPGILVGRELVKQTHLYTGEEVRVVSPLSDPANPDATGTPIPFNRDYRVAGIFFTGMYEYDLKYVYVSLDSLDEFLDRGDTIDGIEVRVPNPDDSGRYVERIGAVLGPQYRVQDWNELNRSLFTALKLEKYAMFLVLGIVILVASFAIVGNLIMVVIEKAREIALLKTLGASDVNIVEVFAIQGVMLGMLGTVLGVATGLGACWAGKKYGIPLDPNVYYIDRMPVNVEASSVLLTTAAGVVISILATFYPAFLAARVRPAVGMRH